MESEFRRVLFDVNNPTWISEGRTVDVILIDRRRHNVHGRSRRSSTYEADKDVELANRSTVKSGPYDTVAVAKASTASREEPLPDVPLPERPVASKDHLHKYDSPVPEGPIADKEHLYEYDVPLSKRPSVLKEARQEEANKQPRYEEPLQKGHGAMKEPRYVEPNKLEGPTESKQTRYEIPVSEEPSAGMQLRYEVPWPDACHVDSEPRYMVVLPKSPAGSSEPDYEAVVR